MYRLTSTFAFMKNRNYLTLLIANCLWTFPHSIFDPYASLYFLGLGGTYFTIGFIWGVTMVIIALSSIPGGYIADYYGRYRLIAAGSFLTATMVFFSAIAPDWRWPMVVIWAQAAFNMFVPAQSAMLMDSIPPEKRGIGFATFATVSGLVGVPGPYIGGYLYKEYGFIALRWGLLLMFSFEIVCSLVKILFLKETLVRREAVAKKGLRNFFAEALKETYNVVTWMPRALRAIVLLAILWGVIELLTYPFWVIYGLNVIKLFPDEWGLILTIQTAVGIAIGIPSGWIVDKIGKRNALLLTGASSSTLLIAFIYCRNLPQALVVLVTYAVCGSLTSSAFSALQTDLTPREKRGRISAAFTMLTMLTFPASFLSGILFGVSPSLPFYMGGALAAIGFLMVSMVIKESEKPEM